MKLPMMSCPRWQKCNANVCPLDSNWRDRTHGPGDKVCLWLVEAVKPGSEKRFELCATQEIHQQVVAAIPAISARWSAIRRLIDRARGTGSRLDRVAPQRAVAVHGG